MIDERSLCAFQFEAKITGSEEEVRRDFQDYFDRYADWDGYGGRVVETPHEISPGQWRAIITRFRSCD